MGEHGTWFDYLNRFEWWRHLDSWAKTKLQRTFLLSMFETGWTLTHVLVALLVVAFCTWGALAFFRGTQTEDQGIVPPRTMNLRNFFEYMAEGVYGMVEGAMGEKNAARFFPLIGALWFFILSSNLIGLIPGFDRADRHAQDQRRHRADGVPADPLLRGQGARPGLLQALPRADPRARAADATDRGRQPRRPPAVAVVRLMGNMMADHKVVFSFFALVPLLVPLPFMLLGLLVCLIQALVFCTLTMVYISMAIEHEHDEH